jgi:transposase-like protein
MKRENRRVPVEPLRVSRNGKRFFSETHKQAVVEKCLVPGASVSAVALAHGFNTNLVRKWIVKHQASRALIRRAGTLLPVSVIEAPAKSTNHLVNSPYSQIKIARSTGRYSCSCRAAGHRASGHPNGHGRCIAFCA